MTEQMKLFLMALADLLDAHGIATVAAVDDGADYYPSVDGVEFQIWTQWDADGNEVRGKCNVRLHKEFDADDVRDFVTANVRNEGLPKAVPLD